MKVVVVGAGAWGSAIALAALRGGNKEGGNHVTLWGRDAEQIAQMRTTRCNERYLPNVTLDERLNLSSPQIETLEELLPSAQLIIIGTPMSALRPTLETVRNSGSEAALVWLCKGFESGSGLMPHEVVRAVAPHLRCGALSGPSFALEVARAQPTCLVAASEHAYVRQAVLDALHSPSLRVYANEDIIGVEVGAAVKNVLAIAAGLCDGLELGLNARAALLTRGLAEMSRLGVALGAQAQTFMGLSGMGDLLLTATGELSRNRQVGLQLAQGCGLQEAVRSLGHVAEGVYSAPTVLERARSLGVEMPITEAVVALLRSQIEPHAALEQLMTREPREEH